MRENLGDWNNHLSDTFVFFTREGVDAVFPVYVHGIRGPGGEDIGEYPPNSDLELEDVQIAGRIISYRDGEYRMGRNTTYKPFDRYNVSIDLPPLGLVNYSNYIVYMTYNNERQFKKGFNRRIVELSTPLARELYATGKRVELDLHKELIYRAVNRESIALDTALKSLYDGETLGRSLSPQFALLSKIDVDVPVLLYKSRYAVGYADENGDLRIPQQLSYLHEELTQSTNISEDRVKYD